jgi:hypothetical protein
MDSAQGGSFVASKIEGQNSIPSSLLNNSRIADITQQLTSTLFPTQRWSLNIQTATPVTIRCSSSARGGTSSCGIVSRGTFRIAITPTPLTSLGNLPTPIPTPDTRMIITNPL